MHDGPQLARILDDGAQRLLASSGEDEGSDEHPYRLTMAIAFEINQLIGAANEPHFSGSAYVVLMQISDLADDPRGPLSFELCETVAKRFAREWLALPDREQEAVQGAFLKDRWWQNFDARVKGLA